MPGACAAVSIRHWTKLDLVHTPTTMNIPSTLLPVLVRSGNGAVLVALLTGCSHCYYMPNMQQVPLFRARGEARLACASSSGGQDQLGQAEASGLELQSAYAVTDHIGLMLNALRLHDSSEDGTRGTGRLIEGGVGYYHVLWDHLVFEGYAGAGRGDVRYADHQVAFSRGFVQPSIGFASRNFDIAVVGRFCYLDYGDPSSPSNAFTGGGALDPLILEQLTPQRWLIEPGFVLRAGSRSVKLQLQYCHAKNLGEPLKMIVENVSFGLQLNFNNSFAPRAPARRSNGPVE